MSGASTAPTPCGFSPPPTASPRPERATIKKLQGDSEELRLRVGDYRVRFTEEPQDTLMIHSVRHRSEAYR